MVFVYTISDFAEKNKKIYKKTARKTAGSKLIRLVYLSVSGEEVLKVGESL